MTNNALLVLESPWGTPKEDPKRTSVLPFLQGLERIKNNFNVYYSTFYDNHGLEKALEKDLTRTKEKRQILYIAAHGGKNQLVNDEARKALKMIPKYGRYIKGVMLGCCRIGLNLKIVKSALSYSEESGEYGANWIFCYKYYIDWTYSMLLDLSILENIFDDENTNSNSKEKIINTFYNALKLFDKNYEIATDDSGNSKKLYQSIRLIVRGKGAFQPKDVTNELLLKLGWEKEG